MAGSMNWSKNKRNQRIKNQLREENLDVKNDIMIALLKSEKANEEIKSLTEEQKYKIYGSDYNSFGPFGPTRKQVLSGQKPNEDVECLHCNAKFKMLDMVFEHRFGGTIPYWFCPNKNCNGAGYKFDIHPIKKKGFDKRKYWCEQLSEIVENDRDIQRNHTINTTKQKERSRKRKGL